MLKVMISAGEASGDSHAAHAISALRDTGLEFECFGMGAGALQAAGTELIVDCRDLAVIGFVDVLLNYHKFLQRLKKLRSALVSKQPDILVLVDFPDFNLKLAHTAKQQGIPVLFYVSPQIWAWRSGRIHKIGRLVSHMAVLFPFEVPYYQKENIPVTYVGNPVVEDAVCSLSKNEAKQQLGLPERDLTIGLLPGSRLGELKRILPPLLDGAKILQTRYTSIQFVIPRADTLDPETLRVMLSDYLVDSDVSPVVITGESITVMRACDLVICASGTATLETALIGTPLILVYKVSRINYEIMRRLIQIDYLGLANIVAQKQIIPELIQFEATGENIAREASSLLDNEDIRHIMIDEMKTVKQIMGSGGASKKVAGLVRQLLKI